MHCFFCLFVCFYLKADNKAQQTLTFCKSYTTNAYQILQKNDEIIKIRNIDIQGLNNDNQKSSLADDFLHHQIIVMMLQETRITGQGVHKITSSNGTELLRYNPGLQSTSYSGTDFLVTTKAEVIFKPISERISILTKTMKKRKYCFISVYTPTNESTVKDPEKTQTLYEQSSDIIRNINRNHLDFQSKRNLRRNKHFLAWGRESRTWEI